MSHICSQCEPVKLYASSDALRKHRKVHHSATKPSFQCSKCDKPPFSRQDHLTRHDKESHTGEYLEQCDFCSGTFAKRNLQGHKRTCKSRFFDQVIQSHTIKAYTGDFHWKSPTLLPSPLKNLGENMVNDTEQILNVRFVRGYVVPKPRRRKRTRRNGDESEADTGQQRAHGVLPPTLDLDSKQWTEIVGAIEKDDIALFNETIDQRPDPQGYLYLLNKASEFPSKVNCLQERFGSLLHLAAARGSIRFAQMLLSAGVSANLLRRAETPFHLAIRHCRFEMAKTLLLKGADIDARDQWGKTALIERCSMRDGVSEEKELSALKAVEFLIEHGASINAECQSNCTALLAATEKHAILLIRRLLAAGAAVNGSSNERVLTPLMEACHSSRTPLPKTIAAVTVLMQYGADVNLLRRSRWRPTRLITALSHACRSYDLEEEDSQILSLLLAAGADPNLGDVFALEEAIIHSGSRAVKLLLDAKADPSRLPDKCIEILQGLRKPESILWYIEREERLRLLQEHYPDMFGNREYLESDTEDGDVHMLESD